MITEFPECRLAVEFGPDSALGWRKRRQGQMAMKDGGRGGVGMHGARRVWTVI